MNETTKRNWGGARPGGGKKAKVPGSPATSPVTIKLSDVQKQKLQRLGGAHWVRNAIDNTEEPTPTTP